jgi:hypothetical protein
MKNIFWVLWFVGLIILALWNKTETPADPIVTWGGWLTFFIIALIAITPLVISRDSPKLISNKLGTTIASPNPLKEIPEQPGHPAYGIYAGGSVNSWLFKETASTTRAYIIAPIDLVYVAGEEGHGKDSVAKGMNVDVNCHLEYYRHDTLPPHVLEALQSLNRPAYNADMPVLYGWWPIRVNELSDEDKQKYLKYLMELGIPKEKTQDAMRFLEMAACKLTKFKYSEQLTKMETNLLRREKIVNAENADLKERIEYLKKELTDMDKRQSCYREPRPPDSIFQIPRREQPTEQPTERPERDY